EIAGPDGLAVNSGPVDGRMAFTAWRVGVIALLIAAVIVPHYMTPANAMNVAWHEVHRHLLYLPILLAAMWFVWRGGLLTAILISLLFFPHLFAHEGSHEGMHGMDHEHVS